MSPEKLGGWRNSTLSGVNSSTATPSGRIGVGRDRLAWQKQGMSTR